MPMHAAPLTPANSTVGLPIIAPPVVPAKRAPLQGSEPSPQKPKPTVEDSVAPSGSSARTGAVEEAKDQPPKKKRRVALTRVGDIEA
jgi:chromatin assembly factor 1 subunit B